MPGHKLTENDVKRLFAALSSEVQNSFSITSAAQLFRAAGFSQTGLQYWQPLMRNVDMQFDELSSEEKLRTVRVLAERLTNQTHRPDVGQSAKSLLLAHGFQFVEGTFVPVGLFDERETRFLPEPALGQISTALDRLIDGDMDGALSAACSAVETVIGSVVPDLGPSHSFQQKVKAAIDSAGRLQAVETQLVGLGWNPDRAKRLCQNLQGALNHAAFVMQTLRSDMGDVHGAKPVLEPLVYDSLKLATVLVSLIKPTD